MGDAADHQEQAHQQAQRLKVNGAQRAIEGLRRLLPDEIVDQAHQHQGAADDAVGFRGQVPAVGGEGGQDQQADGTEQQHRGDHVLHRGHLIRLRDGILLFPEDEVDDQRRQHRAQLHHEEHGERPLVEEKVHEGHVQGRAQHDGGGVAHQGGRALEIGGHGDGDDEGDRVGLQLLADLDGHGGDHQHRGHIVHKGGDDTGEQAQANGGPLDIGHLCHDHVRHPLGHPAVDEQLHQTHGAADHQQDIEIQGGQDLPGGQHTGDDEDHAGGQGEPGTILAEGQHQNVRSGKKDDCR